MIKMIDLNIRKAFEFAKRRDKGMDRFAGNVNVENVLRDGLLQKLVTEYPHTDDVVRRLRNKAYVPKSLDAWRLWGYGGHGSVVKPILGKWFAEKGWEVLFFKPLLTYLSRPRDLLPDFIVDTGAKLLIFNVVGYGNLNEGLGETLIFHWYYGDSKRSIPAWRYGESKSISTIGKPRQVILAVPNSERVTLVRHHYKQLTRLPFKIYGASIDGVMESHRHF